MKSYTCPSCKEIDREIYDIIKEYILAHPSANVLEVAEVLKLKPTLILKYVEEGSFTIKAL